MFKLAIHLGISLSVFQPPSLPNAFPSFFLTLLMFAICRHRTEATAFAFNEEKCVNLLFSVCSLRIGVRYGGLRMLRVLLFSNQVLYRRAQQFPSLHLSLISIPPLPLSSAPQGPSCLLFHLISEVHTEVSLRLVRPMLTEQY